MASSSSSSKHNVQLSKALSSLLRHNLLNQGLRPTADGYVDVDAVLALPRFRAYDLQQIESVVSLNDKQRFSLRKDDETGRVQIRANQGHTIKTIEIDLTPIIDPSDYPRVVHGTYLKKWPLIKSSGGLNRMARNHIHFARGVLGEEGVVSGMRGNCDVHIHVDVEKAINDGYKFFESVNKVILCPGNSRGTLPIEYFKKVIHFGKRGKEFNLLEDKGTEKN